MYQATRSRLRGPSPADAGASSRLIRALTVSTVLDAAYAIIVGPYLLRLTRSTPYGNPDLAGLASHLRLVGLLGLVLLVIVPIVGALLGFAGTDVVRRVRRRWPNLPRLAYDPTPRAWDFAFRNIEPTYIRVQTTGGGWIGGWYGPHSFISSYPEPRELYIETAHQMGEDGTIGAEQPGSGGIYVRCEDVQAVEFIDGQQTPDNEASSSQETPGPAPEDTEVDPSGGDDHGHQA